MNIVNDILVNTLFPDTDFVQTLAMNSVVPKYVENQEKGNPSVCKNCAEAPFKDLHIYGRSEQMTTTGAQLLDFSDLIGKTETKNGATYKINEDQSVSVSGTPTKYTSFYLKGISLKAGSYCFIDDQNSNEVFVQLIGKGNMSKNFTLTEDADVSVYVVFNVNENNTKTFDSTIKAMLNTGSTAIPWEPYTGGKPSPSPDYPQEIVSAGEDGNIGVEVHGKNIFGGRYYYAIYSHGVLFIDKSQKDKEVKFPYQPEEETRGICKVLKCQKGKTYVISVTNPNKNATVGMAEYENIEKALGYTNNVGFSPMYGTKQQYTAKSDGILVCGIASTWTDGKTTLHECTESELLQVEQASEATSYEPYHTPQTLILSTPNGLPGIMVTSSGNYTDENGQQWICDEVDLERGVYVQRVDKGAFDATKALTEQSVILATPIETPLTTAEIAAYKSLRTYRGTTIVEAEDKAGIFVKYNMPMPKLSKNGALRRWFKRHPII